MKHLYTLFSLVIISLLVVSCGTRKSATSDENVSATTSSNLIQQLYANRPSLPTLTARSSFTIYQGEKKTSVGGSLKMRRGEIIQLSLVAMGIVEVGRMEITPQHLTIIDRMGRRYVQVAYADVPFFQESGITFDTFQSLFWNELVHPNASNGEKASYEVQTNNQEAILSLQDNTPFQLTFLADMATSTLRQTRVASRQNPSGAALQWDYQEFIPVGETTFPSLMHLQVTNQRLPLRASLSLSNIKVGEESVRPTDINMGKYQQVSLQDVLSLLKSLQ